MKRLVLSIIMILIMVGVSFADVTWQTANEKTVGWDEVVTTAPGGVISYNVYLANAITDPNKTNPVLIGNTSDLIYTILLNTQGRYYAGVSTVLTIGTDVIESAVNWSDDPAGNANDVAFGIQYFIIGPPGNFGFQ